ncbi:MAG: hypothetical protein U5K75_08955 [Ahrensia sp.]|nr:hypothetical protein [Ahrensia sp.]
MLENNNQHSEALVSANSFAGSIKAKKSRQKLKSADRGSWSDYFRGQGSFGFKVNKVKSDAAKILAKCPAPTVAKNEHATQALVDAGYSHQAACALVLELLAETCAKIDTDNDADATAMRLITDAKGRLTNSNKSENSHAQS